MNTSPANRWQAVQQRDARADGTFVYAVATTGIYCKPSCRSRQPRRDNVAFYDSVTAAQSAGFRACKRCKPNDLDTVDPQAAIVASLCRMLEASETTVRLETLAQHAGWSVFHTQRVFKRITGVTPMAYARAHRHQQMERAVRAEPRVTDAVYSAGFSSSGRFYEAVPNVLGMTPQSYRAGAREQVIRYTTSACVLGVLLVASTSRGLCAVLLGDSKADVEREFIARFPNANRTLDHESLEGLVKQVIARIELPHATLSLPLDVQGTAFQQRVWSALAAIPPGSTVSYAALAASVGTPSAVRAVASACAANPVAVVIPCHRVVRTSGDLAGYRWGITRKKWLLEHERTHKPVDSSKR